MTAIYKRELCSYFRTPLGWCIVALLLLTGGVFTLVMNMMMQYADFAVTLNSMRIVLVVAIPLLTMRSIAEDRHNGTEKLYFSLPLRTHGIILGKFFAMLTLFAVPTLVTASYPLLLSLFGEISLASAYTTLFGYFLMGAALIALCTLISSLFENQLLAGAVSLVASLVLYFGDSLTGLLPASPVVSLVLCFAGALLLGAVAWYLSKKLLVGGIVALAVSAATSVVFLIKKELFADLAPDFLDRVNPFGRLLGFSYGYFDVSGTLFYLSLILLCLFLTVQSMDARRRA